MKIVIELDDNVYGLLKRTERVFKYIDKEDDTVDTALMRAVMNGTPLPEKHGRLIDADAIEYTHAIARSLDDGHNWNELCVTKDELYNAPTIIEGSDSE